MGKRLLLFRIRKIKPVPPVDEIKIPLIDLLVCVFLRVKSFDLTFGLIFFSEAISLVFFPFAL